MGKYTRNVGKINHFRKKKPNGWVFVFFSRFWVIFNPKNLNCVGWMFPSKFQAVHLSEKRAPGCSRYIGEGIILPDYVGIIINHQIRIPIKQPVFHGKSPIFFSVAHLSLDWRKTMGRSNFLSRSPKNGGPIDSEIFAYMKFLRDDFFLCVGCCGLSFLVLMLIVFF